MRANQVFYSSLLSSSNVSAVSGGIWSTNCDLVVEDIKLGQLVDNGLPSVFDCHLYNKSCVGMGLFGMYKDKTGFIEGDAVMMVHDRDTKNKKPTTPRMSTRA